MFCVKCGADCDNTFNGLCIECFLNGRKLLKLPHHIDLERCTNCEEYCINDKWLQMEQSDAVEEIALTGMMIIPEAKIVSVGTISKMQDERTFEVTVQADFAIDDYMTQDEEKTIVRIKNGVCKKCSRQLGNYYEATLQLRSGGKELDDDFRDELVRRVRDNVEAMSKMNRQLFITKVQQVPGGIDMLMSSTSMTRNLAKDLSDSYGADTKESASLVGMTSDGLDMYRMTFLVRFPAYHTGDILDYMGKPCKLVGLNKSGGKVVMLNDFREMPVRKSEIQDMSIIKKRDDIKEALVISSSGNEIQVMHPRSYATVDLRVPEGTEIGENVKVVQIEEVLYYVP